MQLKRAIESRHVVVLCVLAIAALLSILTIAALTDDGGKSPAVEVSRVMSPGGDLEAVVQTRGTPATVSTPYDVFVVLRGKQPVADDLILAVDKSYAPETIWQDAGSLEIRCAKARIWQFTNSATPRLATGGFDFVAVKLSCGENGYR